MLEYSLLVPAIEKATNAILGVLQTISEVTEKGEKTKQSIQDMKEKKRLKYLLGKVQGQRYSQAPLPWLLRLTYMERKKGRKHTIANWTHVQQNLMGLSDNVAEILELLQDEDGDFVVVCRDAYEALLFGMRDRVTLIDALRQLPPPKDEDDFEALLKIADYYTELIKYLLIADRDLAAYFTGSNNSTLRLGYKHPVKSLHDDFFPNWDGTVFLKSEKDK